MTTLLDQAQADWAAEGLGFYRALADAELFVVLETEAVGAVMTPRVFDLSDGPLLLVFDSEERLAGFGSGPVPYAALPGRVIAAQIVGQGLALGLNLGTGAASEMILPPEAIIWLMQMLDQAPAEEVEAAVLRFEAPAVPEAVLQALTLVISAGPAWLAGAVYATGQRGVMLALSGVQAADQARMARAVTEGLAFSGLDASELDLVFVTEGDAVVARMAGVGLMFRPEVRPAPALAAPKPPGSDPDRPPILR